MYLVKHRTLATVHALKLLTYRSADVDARFVREGVVQSQLDHPHVVRVRDVLELPEGPALLMDHVAGPDLYTLAHRGPISAAEIVGLLHGILRGLAYAHGRLVIHRDLKPTNILLERSGNGVSPRLVDFGLAKALAGPAAQGFRTRTGLMMGTPIYMPPEQMRDAARVDIRADLFALGAVVYSLAMGAPPWPGPSLMNVIRERKDGAPRRLDEMRRDIPGDLAEVTSAMLELDRDFRPATAFDVMDALGLASEPVAQAVAPVTGPAILRALG